MITFKLSSFQEKIAAGRLLSERITKFDTEKAILNSEDPYPLFLSGYSYPAKKIVNFKIDLGPNGNINWRESLICPITGLINRWRAAIHLFELECKPDKQSNIYISEFISPLYSYLNSIYPNIIGSEFLGEEIKPGSVIDGTRHEDLTNLSFEDESLDYCLSFDCFEHMPNPTDAFKCCYSKLKKGGGLFWTVPFALNREKNAQRAKKDEFGNIVHILAPEYHGDPLCKEGALTYHVFGWEILDQVRDAGFKDVYALLYWSEKFGYLGGLQSAFFAFK